MPANDQLPDGAAVHTEDDTAAPAGDRVVLTGFMGTGKTSTGRILARILGYEFVDTDRIIEDRHGPISEIFARDGEDAFRQREQEVSAELGERAAIVVSTGGRLMLDPHNVAHLSANAQVFCLVAPTEEIVRRLTSPNPNRTPRPLLAGDNPAERVAALLAERNPHYARFVQVPTLGLSPAAVARVVALWARASPRRIEGNNGARFYVGASVLGSARRTGASEDPVVVVATPDGEPFVPSVGPSLPITLNVDGSGGSDPVAAREEIATTLQRACPSGGSECVTVVTVGNDRLRGLVAEIAADRPSTRHVHAPVGLDAMEAAARNAVADSAVLADVVTLQQSDPAKVTDGNLQRMLDEATSAICRGIEGDAPGHSAV